MHRSSSWLPCAAAVSVLLLSFHIVPGAGATPEWLAVAPAHYAGEFQRLADHRMAEGLSAGVVTLESVWSRDLAGGDPPARLRAFLREAQAGGTRYVLLGGDASVVPARGTVDAPNSYPGLSDLYLVCFGAEWDADGDGVYDEVPGPDDVVPAMAIGRAPVCAASQARAFVDKVLAYETSSSEPYRRQVLLAGVVLTPYPWTPGQPVQLDMASWCEDLRTTFEAPPFELGVQRLYQNHAPYAGAELLSPEEWLARLATGDFGLVQVGCRADAGRWEFGYDGQAAEYLTRNDAKETTTAGRGFFMQALAWDGASHGPVEGMMTTLVRAPAGGCVGAVGFAGAPYVASSYAVMANFWGAALGDFPRAGDAWAAAIDAIRHNYPGRKAAIIYTCLGDPALRVQPTLPNRARVMALALQVAPNPFNPATNLVFELDRTTRVRLDMFDLLGHRVASLIDEERTAGRHEVSWQGRDDTGDAVAAGVYLARLNTPLGTATRRLILVK